jgi:4-amino-4-deoxy-L-arabinose transferase-like glycosyltransferase
VVSTAAAPIPTTQMSRRWLPFFGGDSAVDFLWVLLGLTLVRGILYAVLSPPFGSPDEMEHFQYIKYLATGGNAVPKGDEGSQPVPYYALMVPAYWVTSGQLPAVQDLAIRLASLPFLLGTVIVTWLAAQKMAPNRPLVPVVAAAFVGFHPQLAYIGSSVNNDSAANLMAAVLVYLVICLLAQKRHGWTMPATLLALGAAPMTKGQILSVLAVCAVVVLVTAGHGVSASSPRWRVVYLACLGVPFLVAIGAASTEAGAFLLVRSEMTLSILTQWDRLASNAKAAGLMPFSYQFLSFWAAFLGESVRPLAVWYAAPFTMVLLGVVGYGRYCLGCLTSHRSILMQLDLRYIILVVIAVAVWVVPLLYFLNGYDYPENSWRLQALQGRYLFVSLLPTAILVGNGLDLLIRNHILKPASAVILLTLAAFDVVSLAALVGYYRWPTGG